jgi:hypothetical protein
MIYKGDIVMKSHLVIQEFVALILLVLLTTSTSYASTEGERRALQASDANPNTTITLNFDDYPDGTRISEQYTAQGVHFMNDYYPDVIYRASPMVKTHENAKSAPNVLVNGYYDPEFNNSSEVPLILWFDQPVAGVGMWLGTRQMSEMFACAGTYTAKVTATDCNGSLVGEKTVSVSSGFNTPFEIDDAQGRIQMVKIDYGDSPCPEAIDDLAFQTTDNTCTDVHVPKVTITSHPASSIVNTAKQEIKGTVADTGILKSVKINGTPVGYYQSYGLDYFHGFVTLKEGSNTITVLAEDKSGNKGSDQVVITLGTPSSASIAQFHLTQRGVVFNKSCDIDKPLVAGKSALVRLDLSVKSAGGLDTYASSVNLMLYRKTGSGDTLVGTLQGSMYSPYLSMFSSASDMSAINFWVDADMLDPPGEYKFVFQPFVGTTAIGDPLTANCAGDYHQFYNTNPIRLLIVPAEHASMSSVFDGTDHLSLYYKQLDKVLSAYPIRESMSKQLNSQAGLIVQETNPVKWCDGVNTDPVFCPKTGWTWKFIDHDASGILIRADDAPVLDLTNNTICGGGTENRNQTIGGRIISTSTFSYPFYPAIGMIRNGAHMEWYGAKYVTFFDEDHDYDIDAIDRQKFISEFFDLQTNQWSTNLNLYDDGETFRFFEDQDGDNCNDFNTEPQAPVRQLFTNELSMIDNAGIKTFENVNQNIPGTSQDFKYTSVWIANILAPPDDFRSFGPGQGDQNGYSTWIRVMNVVAMAHELGHNLGLVNRYSDTIPDDIKTSENPWVVYINGKARQPQDVFEIMEHAMAFDDMIFGHTDYSALFYKVTQSVNAQPEAVQIGTTFTLSALLNLDDTLEAVTTGTSSSLLPTQQDPTSPYTLVFGLGTTLLSSFPFAPEVPAAPPEGYDSYPKPYRILQVTAPIPPATQWVELRKSGQTLGHFERSAQSPIVQVLFPDGGESFSAAQTVNIQWQASDPDSEELMATISYSPNGGESWQLLAAEVSGGSFSWNTTNSPGSKNGRIRVEVSDGFNSGQDDSNGTFTVGGKPPQVVILEPVEGQVFLQCSGIRVRGVAIDPEGSIAYQQWWVDDTESSTQLTAQLPPLTPGQHLLSLRVMDADGMQSNDQIQVTIQPDSDCDSMSDEFEAAYGLDPGDVQDAAWDTDEDGLRNFEEAWYGTSPDADDTDGDGYLDGDEVLQGSDPTDPTETPVRLYLVPTESTIDAGDVTTLELRIDNVKHLYAFQLKLEFDPAILEVVDAYPGIPGVQIEEGDFFVADIPISNQADNSAGMINYSASLEGIKPGVDGSGVLARITLQGKSSGRSGMDFTRAILSDPSSLQIPASQAGAQLTVQQSTGNISGKVLLERRASSAGVSLCLDSNCTTTSANGNYEFLNLAGGEYLATATHPSYLQSQMVVQFSQNALLLPDVTLLGGDINQDDVIELADAILIGHAWNSTPASPNWDIRADITADNQVNVLDMVAVQYNWNVVAPSPWGTTQVSYQPLNASIQSQGALTQVRVVPLQIGQITPGTLIDIEIQANALQDLYGYRLQITFDPSILRLVDANPNTPGVQILAGDIFQGSDNYEIVNTEDNSTGVIDFAITQLSQAQDKNDMGIMAKLTFEVLANGRGSIQINQARLLDGGLPIPQEIPVNIQNAEILVGANNRTFLPFVNH